MCVGTYGVYLIQESAAGGGVGRWPLAEKSAGRRVDGLAGAGVRGERPVFCGEKTENYRARRVLTGKGAGIEGEKKPKNKAPAGFEGFGGVLAIRGCLALQGSYGDAHDPV